MKKSTQHSLYAVCFHERPLVVAIRQALPYVVGLSLALSMVPSASSRGNESAAAFTATQLVRQFTLKNTVTQVSLGMQGYVSEVNGQQRGPAMGPRPVGFPTDMGSVPSTVNLPRRDGAGRPLGYCAWDNSSAMSTADYNAGQIAGSLIYAIVSPGLNGTIQTTCADVLLNGTGLGDDHVQVTAPIQVSSKQYKTSVGTFADLSTTPGEEGDIRLVRDTNKLYSFVGGVWAAVQSGPFEDNSAVNGAGAISYTTGKVTVADFQATAATITGAVSADSATFTNGVVASTFTGSGAGLTDLNAANFSSGIVSPEFGGTGVNGAAAANGALLIGTGAGFALGSISAGDGIGVLNGAGSITISNTGVLSVAGTNNQIITSAMNGDVVLSLPQDIATTSMPTFAGQTLTGNLMGTSATFGGSVSASRMDVGNSFGGVANPNVAVGTGALANGAPSGTGKNSAFGYQALYQNSTGYSNSAIGFQALYSNATGYLNVAVGESALFNNTTGYVNTATGTRALFNNTIGQSNVANGYRALYSNTSGSNNVANGPQALHNNTTGSSNSANGPNALYSNTSGNANVANGTQALYFNTTGNYNVANGGDALQRNTTGNYNVATGNQALFYNTSGAYNVAAGSDALASNANGSGNVGIGRSAGSAGFLNIRTGSNSVFIGANAAAADTAAMAGSGSITLLGSSSTASGLGAANANAYMTAIGAGSHVTTINTVSLGRTTDITVIGATGTATSGILQNKKLQVTGDVGISGALTIGGTFTATGFSGNGSGLTDLNASNINSGTVGVAYGGTGLNGSAAANGQLLIGNGSGFALANLTAGTGITITNSVGGISIAASGSTVDKASIDSALSFTTGNLTLGSGSLSTSTTGSYNTALGQGTLAGVNFVGLHNTAVGYSALNRLTNSTNNNTAVGSMALSSLQNGTNNVAIGSQASRSLQNSSNNISIGNNSQLNNVAGTRNIAIGSDSSYINSSQNDILAIGHEAGYGSGAVNANSFVAVGNYALRSIQNGSGSVAVGYQALRGNTDGLNNVAMGRNSGYATSGGAATNANTTGANNTFIGAFAMPGTTSQLNYAAALGSDSRVTTSNTIVLGRTTDTTVIGATGTASSGILQDKILQVTGNVGISGNLEIGGTFSATSFSGNGSALTNLNASNISTGTLAVARGGTGLDASAAANGALLIGNGSGFTLGALAGTVDQVNVSNGPGTITLSLPQNMATTSSPTFAAMALTGALTATRINLSDLSGVSFPNLIVGAGAMAAPASGNGNNTAIGISALAANTSGAYNVAVGRSSMAANTIGFDNVAVGWRTLFQNTSGSDNVAVGDGVLYENTTGYGNTAVGDSALAGNVTGIYNSALGSYALWANTTGSSNVAIGRLALGSHTSPSAITAVGANALASNTTGQFLVAIGESAMSESTGTQGVGVGNYVLNNDTGQYNVAVGNSALSAKTSGDANTAVGHFSLTNITGGNDNISMGHRSGNALLTGSGNTFLGTGADVTGGTTVSGSTALGFSALVSTDNTIVLGRTTDTTVIGATGAATSGNLMGGKLQVTGDIRTSGNVYAAGVQLTSDRRLKTDINQIGNDLILGNLAKLNAYKYRLINDPTGQVRVGVIAQELAALFPELAKVGYGGYYSVDYSALGTLAAAGVGRLSIQFNELDKTVRTQGQEIELVKTTLNDVEKRVGGLESWKIDTIKRMDNMQSAIDLNIEKIAVNALAIASNTEKITTLEQVTQQIDTRLIGAEGSLDRIEQRWKNTFSTSEDGQTLTVKTPNLIASNFMAAQIRARSAYTERLDAEMARIRTLEVDNLKANHAVARNVQAEIVNTGSVQVYAGVGLPALLFAASADGHYTVSTSAIDGSYATATVIVNAGQAKVVPVASEGIQLVAEGNQVKAIAAGKSIRASWIKMG